MPQKLPTYYETLTAAVADLAEHGYTSMARVEEWVNRVRAAARRSMVPEHTLEADLKRTLRQVYERVASTGALKSRHPDLGRFTLQKVRPHLRQELDRRILASAGLIKLNREAMIEKTVQRLSGWMVSVPPGGTPLHERQAVKDRVREPLSKLAYEERRVLIDQSFKLTANLNELIAVDGGAIAATWHDHGEHERSYDARKVHLARTPKDASEHADKMFLVRDSWAHQLGYVKPGPAGYTDQVERPGQLVFCRCWYRWYYTLRRLPVELLTEKGKAALAEASMRRAA